MVSPGHLGSLGASHADYPTRRESWFWKKLRLANYLNRSHPQLERFSNNVESHDQWWPVWRAIDLKTEYLSYASMNDEVSTIDLDVSKVESWKIDHQVAKVMRFSWILVLVQKEVWQPELWGENLAAKVKFLPGSPSYVTIFWACPLIFVPLFCRHIVHNICRILEKCISSICRFVCWRSTYLCSSHGLLWIFR